MYLPRTAGLALSTFVWPHLAYRLGISSADPYSAERRSLMIDSALGGAFIALMKFNLLPSVLLVVMLSMDELAVGGLRFLARCTLAFVAAEGGHADWISHAGEALHAAKMQGGNCAARFKAQKPVLI